tara:strand:- start:574 stop:990 length:417 start_codon:yes stop_codon:yes gene_type:complete
MTDDQVEAKIKSNINDYIFENNLDEFIESISKINLPSKSNKIIYYWILYILENESNMEIGIKLLNVCIQKKIIKYNTLKYGLIEFLSDYDSFKWDYPNLNNILNEIFLSCKKNRFLTFDNLKFIISKGNKKLEDTFKI